MTAVNHPVSPMGTLRWLLKREYWENRGGFLYAPLIAGLISLVMSTVGIAFGLFALNRAARNGALHVDGESVNINGLDLALLTRDISAKDLADLGNGLDLTLVLSSAWPFLVLAFVVFLAEGSMLDWSAVFLAEVRQVPRDQAGAGFALFTLAMTAMRLFGDGIVERLGRTRTLVIGGITAAAGFTLATLVPSFPVALAGYVLVGLGCANIVPALFSMAGQQRVMPESIAITAVTTLGYAGILAGPAAIGALAHATSLGFAFLCVAALLLGVAASARALARRVA